MGDTCTLGCALCNVTTGRPKALDPFEPGRVAKAVASLEMWHVVITSDDRDDLEDGGAGHIVQTIRAIRHSNPDTTIEILTPDFPKCDPSIFNKSGLMFDLGEDRQSVYQAIGDLRAAKANFLTIGQYLQPSPKYHAVARYITAEEFAVYKATGLGKVFLLVSATPLTRSSYHADTDFHRRRMMGSAARARFGQKGESAR